MARFYPLKVSSLERETEDCTVISFDLPEDLQNTFAFKQGQHLTLRKYLNGEDVRRTYSLCISPSENKLAVAVKKIPTGLFSSFVNEELKAGDILDVMPPMGSFFTELHSDQQKSYVAFAAGSGITPIISIMKAVLESEPKSRFTLFYVNQRVSSIIFKEEIEGLKNKYLNRLQIYHFLTREQLDVPLFYGRIDIDKLNAICNKLINPLTVDEYFLCGPQEMVETIRNGLVEKGVAKNHIHSELFFTLNGQKKAIAKDYAKELNGSLCAVTIRDGGKQFAFSFDGNDNILDAALKQGADLPFACKGGVCCTCKAKLLEGKVEMEVNYALEPEEVEAGYILTCQAHPLSQKVVVDYDQAI